MDKIIYIIGAGAIGKALAVFLTNNNRKVIILKRNKTDVNDCSEKINVELPDGNFESAKIEIKYIDEFDKIDGIIVLTNKSYGNEEICNKLKNKSKNSTIVFLQNGLGVENLFLIHGFQDVYRCVLFATSQIMSPNNIRFKPVSFSQIGIVKGNYKNLSKVVSYLNTDNFKFSSNYEIQNVIWEKAIVNCVFNSVCPLLEIDNGVFYREPKALKIAVEVISECLTIAQAYNIDIELSKIVDMLLLISKSSDGQLISTYQDIINKRKTEIESLNFAIVNYAQERNMLKKVPLTKLLGELIKLKSKADT